MGLFSRAVRALTAITQNIFTTPHQNWLNNDGVPLANGKLYVYAAGTQTPVNTWQDNALTQLNTNPIILDAGGFTTVWLNPGSLYKFRMVDQFGAQQWTVDNYAGGSLTANILVPLNFIIPAFAANDINNGSNTQIWRWIFTGSNQQSGFSITEPGPSTNTWVASDGSGRTDPLVDIYTAAGSTATPLQVIAQTSGVGGLGGAGLAVLSSGNIQTIGSAIFIGPVRIPQLPSAPFLSTDPVGNIISGLTAGSGSGVPLNFILPATAPNDINNGSNTQTWRWLLPSTESGLYLTEPGPSTGVGSALLGIATLAGSNASPFIAVAQAVGGNDAAAPGLSVDPTGNIVAWNGSIFIGPLRIPTLLNQPALGTDPQGNIIAGTGGGPGGGIQSINLDTTPAQQIVAGPGVDVSTAVGTGVTTISIAPSLASLTMAPASVLGPASSTGTVTLASPALAAGVTVTLSSNNANVVVPASVSIAAGATTATFIATTVAVGANVTAVITASYGGVNRTANLTVTAPVVPVPIYGGVGAPGATATVTSGPGTGVTLSNGTVLAQLQTTAEVVGSNWPFSPSNQSVYLLLTGASRTFQDAVTTQPFVMNSPPTTVTSIAGRTLYLYQSTNILLGTFTVRVAS